MRDIAILLKCEYRFFSKAICFCYVILLLLNLTGCTGYRYSRGIEFSTSDPFKAVPVSTPVNILPVEIIYPGTIDLNYLTNQLHDGLNGTNLFKYMEIENVNAVYTIKPTVFLLTDLFDNVVHLEIIVQDNITKQYLYHEKICGSGFSQARSVEYLKNYMKEIGPEIANAIHIFEEQGKVLSSPKTEAYPVELLELQSTASPSPYLSSLLIALANITADEPYNNKANILTSRIYAELGQAEYLSVLSRPVMEKKLLANKFKNMDKCWEERCLIEMGKMLSVPFIAGGKYKEIDNTSYVSLKVIDVEERELAFTIDHGWMKNPDFLLERVKNLARHLVEYYNKQQGNIGTREPVSLDFLQVGLTTKKDILKTLGYPSSHYNDVNIVIYNLQKTGKMYVVVENPTAQATAEYNLVLTFDSMNILKKHSLIDIK